MTKAASAAPETGETRRLGDLFLRTLSALVLIPIGLAVAWNGGPWIAGACGAAALAMS